MGLFEKENLLLFYLFLIVIVDFLLTFMLCSKIAVLKLFLMIKKEFLSTNGRPKTVELLSSLHRDRRLFFRVCL